MKQLLKKIFNVIQKIASVALVLIICFIIFGMIQGNHPKFFGYQIFRVLTSSMQPAISENTCIITKEVPKENLKVGDIITFVSEDPDIYGFYNTHRIYEIVEENGETRYVTKGDANPVPDENLVAYSQVTGIFVGELPGGELIGKFFLLLSDNKIYFLVVMLPLTLCLLSYIWQLIGHFTNRYEEEDEETSGEDEETSGEDEENSGEDEETHGEDDEETGGEDDAVGEENQEDKEA